MRITPRVLVHLRIALLGAAGVSIEDLGTLTWDLAAEIDNPRRPDLPAKRTAAYHELMGVVCACYEMQKTVGLPGDPLDACTLLGQAQQQLVQEVLSDYCDAAELALKDASEMSDNAQQEAAERIEEIAAFLGEGQPSEESAPVA